MSDWYNDDSPQFATPRQRVLAQIRQFRGTPSTLDFNDEYDIIIELIKAGALI